MSEKPVGEERKVEFLGGAAVDGAPVAYVVVMAVVVTVLSFVPFSIALAIGGSMPLAQGIYSLVGWILGPFAGALASGIGALLGVFLAPHTAGVAVPTIVGAAAVSFAAGTMILGKERSKLWIIPAVISAAAWCFMVARSIFAIGVRANIAILSTIMIWSAIILFILPTRLIVARWINSKNLGKVALGLLFGTYISFGTGYVWQTALEYWLYAWPEEVWAMLIPIIPVEFLLRSVLGMIIGTGVIAGMRAIGLVKAKWALY